MLAALVALMLWLLPKVWRALRAIARRIGAWLGAGGHRPAP